VYRQDFSSEVFFKSPPDSAGNVCSPIATVFQSASFISALEELALQAEVVRARQLLVTQPMQRVAGNNNLDPSNLFFDSESRAVQASATAEDDAQQASSLATQARMMAVINRLQTTNAVQQPGSAPAPSAPAHVPPPMPPQLFACPERQQVVPGVRPPEARSDLVDLMRVVNDHSKIIALKRVTTNDAPTRPTFPFQSPLQWACRRRLSCAQHFEPPFTAYAHCALTWQDVPLRAFQRAFRQRRPLRPIGQRSAFHPVAPLRQHCAILHNNTLHALAYSSFHVPVAVRGQILVQLDVAVRLPV
jgi:hypothetical protein